MPISKSAKEETIKNRVLRNLIIAGIAALVIVVGVYIWWGKSGYWAVYLDTGDIYFGKLSVFPTVSLSDAYLLQLTGDQNNPFVFHKFSESVWGPEDRIYINRDNVVWKTRVSDASQLNQIFQNPAAFRNQQPAIGTQVPVGGENTGGNNY